jgi:hypothetical protein
MWGGRKELLVHLTRRHIVIKVVMKIKPNARGYNGATLFLGDFQVEGVSKIE